MKINQRGPNFTRLTALTPLSPLSNVKQRLVLLCGLFLLAGFQARADDSGKYILESLGGTEKLATVESGGTTRTAVEGMELHPGDRLKTGYRTSAKVVYPDGTKVIIGRLSDVRLGEKTGDIQYNDVEAGEIRAVVAKPPKSGDSAKKIKFLIRTKTVVMGVRGTDFLFRHDSTRLAACKAGAGWIGCSLGSRITRAPRLRAAESRPCFNSSWAWALHSELPS